MLSIVYKDSCARNYAWRLHVYASYAGKGSTTRLGDRATDPDLSFLIRAMLHSSLGALRN